MSKKVQSSTSSMWQVEFERRKTTGRPYGGKKGGGGGGAGGGAGGGGAVSLAGSEVSVWFKGGAAYFDSNVTIPPSILSDAQQDECVAYLNDVIYKPYNVKFVKNGTSKMRIVVGGDGSEIPNKWGPLVANGAPTLKGFGGISYPGVMLDKVGDCFVFDKNIGDPRVVALGGAQEFDQGLGWGEDHEAEAPLGDVDYRNLFQAGPNRRAQYFSFIFGIFGAR